jgi:integrase
VTQTNQTGREFTYEAVRPAWQPNGDWMRRSFEIAMAQGCRFSETRMPLSDIDLHQMTIKIRGKGGKVFVTALNPLLVPLIRELKRRGEKMTWDLPATELRQCARNWTRLFKRLGIADFWFHCTRATAITRAHEMGVSYPLAMKFFGHASGTVHAIYTRLGLEDVSPVAAALASYASTRCNRSNGTADAPLARPGRNRAKTSRARHTRAQSRQPSSR